ncbi:MAG: molybdopterin cofactor-binding domain-containing protein, partial [Myxococcota bacterium]
MNVVNVSRRSLLAGLGLSLGGLALGLVPGAGAVEPAAPPSDAPTSGSEAIENLLPGLNPNVFVHVGADGAVTIVCARSEMGQGVRSSLPVLVADELGADFGTVRVVQAVGDAMYGDQNTDGSSSVRGAYD